jgi:hypothetical protein
MPDELGQHAAKKWVESNFPTAEGHQKAILILAYGAGVDAGFVEAQDILKEELAHLKYEFGLLLDQFRGMQRAFHAIPEVVSRANGVHSVQSSARAGVRASVRPGGRLTRPRSPATQQQAHQRLVRSGGGEARE